MPKEYNFFGENDTFGESVACVSVVSMREIDLSPQQHHHAWIQKVLSEGFQFQQHFFLILFLFYLVGGGGGGEDPKPTKNALIDPPAKRHLNGFSLACR